MQLDIPLLQTRLPELKRIHWFAELDSTNDFGKQLLTEGCEVPALIYAQTQTRGRGRAGKSWGSNDGSLTFSWLVETKKEAPAAPHFALSWGVAIAQSLNQLCKCENLFRVKWPNDILAGDRKVSGILIESVAEQPDHFVVGIGINLWGESPQITETSTKQRPPISVGEATGIQIQPAEVLTSIWSNFAALNEIETAEWQKCFKRLDFLNSKKITIQVGKKYCAGEYVGLADDGSLGLRIENQLHRFHSGSIVEWSPSE